MSDVSTLGVKLNWCAEATAGTRPTTGYTQLTRCKTIPGVKLTQGQVDVTCLEDLVKKYAPGIADTGGSWEPVFHSDGIESLEDLITAYVALTGGKSIWFEIAIPNYTKSFFVKAAPPTKLGINDLGEDSPLEVPLSCVLQDIEGFATPSTT